MTLLAGPTGAGVTGCKARKGLHYVETSGGRGYCERCPKCGAGQEFDTNVSESHDSYILNYIIVYLK